MGAWFDGSKLYEALGTRGELLAFVIVGAGDLAKCIVLSD
jgi:hypothetical protein